MMEELKAQFVEDAKELLSELETKIFEVESDVNNKDTIEDIFRVMHNLKGASGMYGFDNIGKLTHELETVYDLVREGVMPVTESIIDITFKSVDILKELLFNNDIVPIDIRSDYDSIVVEIDLVVNKYIDAETHSVKGRKEVFCSNYYIVLKPFKEVFSRGVNLEYFFEDIAGVGQYTMRMHNTQLSLQEQFEKKECSGAWEILVKNVQDASAISDLFIFMLEGEYEYATFDQNFKDNKEIQRISEAYLKDVQFEDTLNFIKEFCGTCIAESVSITDSTNSQLEFVASDIKTAKKNRVSRAEETIRVPSKKLDILMNLVSELVTTKAHLGLIAESIEDARLLKAIEGVEKLSKQLSDLALDVRLMPLESLIVNFKRLVRDVSSSLGKKVHFEIEGAETELDKTIISGLEKPLMHILRNAIDHGVEDLAGRLASNKPDEGMVKLIAFYSGSNVFIQIQDDGAGINKKKVLDKAMSKGLIKADDKLSEREIYNLLFLPGFSTADTLSDISGRGVGMDVVKSEIEDLRGEVEITSEEGLGTTFTLKLPLTLSIIDTLHVKIDGSDYLIPLSDVEGCINRNQQELNENNNSIVHNDHLVPLIDLRKAFGLKEWKGGFQKMVVIQKEDKTIALTVDEVIGEHQAVLKTLGEVFRKQDFISGASIMGDGSVSLVLDTNKLSGLVQSSVGQLELEV